MISSKKPNGEPWYVGDLPEVPCNTTDVTGKAVDPPALTVTIVKPDATEEIGVVPTKTAVGAYYIRKSLTLPGSWQFIWTAPAGEYQGVGTVTIEVRKPRRV